MDIMTIQQELKVIKKTFDWLLNIGIIVLIAVVLYDRLHTPEQQDPPSDIKGTIEASLLTNTLGNGPVAIVEFTDFQCPFCQQFSTTTFPEIKRTLIDTGKVKYIVVNFPLKQHDQALLAAEAAECAADQGNFWPMHDLLFKEQGQLKQLLNAYAGDTCMRTHATKERVQAHLKMALSLKVNATPTILIGTVRKDGAVDLQRRVSGAATLETLASEVTKVSQLKR